MSTRRRQYLYINEPLVASVPLSEEGPGSTVTMFLAESNQGVPSAIGTLTASTSTTIGTPAAYVVTFTPMLLQSQLATYINRTVWLHVRSNTALWYEVYPFVVTNVDPDLLPELLG